MTLLDFTFDTPAQNLACDEALLDAAENGVAGECLRFWEARRHFVVVGYGNKVSTEVNLSACESHKIPIYRRCSGGGTVLQGPGCLNYALVLKISDDSPLRNITTTNCFVMERNRAAIQSAIGDPQSAITIEGHTDLALNGLKFSGNSQRRRKKFLLFHGTFLLNFNLPLIGQLLPMPSHQPDYRNGRPHESFLTNANVSADFLKRALQQTWGASASGTLPTAEIRRLVSDKYGRRDWNFKF